jgi:hypothetical protein
MEYSGSNREAMQVGHDQYVDVIAALDAAGLPTSFTQTGGMNAALEVLLETGQYLLITDAGDSLSWNREQQHGWGVGRYAAGEAGADGPEVYAEDEESVAIEALFVLVRGVLGQSK